MNIDEYFVRLEKRQRQLSGAVSILRIPKEKKNKATKKADKAKEQATQQRISAYKQKYLDYLNSKEWADIKLDLYAIRGKRCESCGAKHGIQVHHLTYENIFNEEPSDLILLCRKCHRKEHK